MRYLLAAFFLAPVLTPRNALAAADGVACLLDASSVVSRSAAGLDQVSNVGDIRVHCSVPAKPVTLKPGESLWAVTTKAARAFLLLPTGAVQEVPVEVIGVGSGNNNQTQAWTNFYLHLPLDPLQRDAEARRGLARLEAEIAKDKSNPHESETEEQAQRKGAAVAELVFQHRAGRFRVECQMTQGDQGLGTGQLAFEVLDKGRFSDLWPFPTTEK